MLPVNYNSVSGADQGQLGRVTKHTAVGQPGKAYLYPRKWQEAANRFKLLIDGAELNVYSLVANFRNNFKPTNESNAESLLEIQFADPSTVGAPLVKRRRAKCQAETSKLYWAYLRHGRFRLFGFSANPLPERYASVTQTAVAATDLGWRLGK
jgi:hypothetical protein